MAVGEGAVAVGSTQLRNPGKLRYWPKAAHMLTCMCAVPGSRRIAEGEWMTVRRSQAQPANDVEQMADPIDIAVGARVKMLRHSKGISQSTLGDAVGVSFQQVQKYERGSNRLSASALVRVAEALGVSVSTLVGEHPGDDEAMGEFVKLVGETGALELLRSYAAIPSGQLRQRVRDLVAELAARE